MFIGEILQRPIYIYPKTNKQNKQPNAFLIIKLINLLHGREDCSISKPSNANSVVLAINFVCCRQKTSNH